ncbi:GGDEF domain-containing protein [Ferdinandcohnia quinoae]|uniref:GGDEF domain-containing protein n=1 Tax=Fredinandcohnia quinoae TaxID=2918902 RepID=A0AAW5E6I1_9BACI|nr:GGDEF domain-containing protein [Fredinandcohnia sp. SECRCQ15]MCH1625225.1 GGDEF domain-containing protein [Fredinandcohnia sp. SECRCQ15]
MEIKFNRKVILGIVYILLFFIWFDFLFLNLNRLLSGILITIPLLLIAYFVLIFNRKVQYFHYLSNHDELTSIYNKRYMVRKLEELKVNNKPFHLYILDINNFKHINDTHGHIVGDKVIEMVADTLIRSTEPGDIIARWGGDEFIVITFENEKQDLRDFNFTEAMFKFSYIFKEKITLSIGKATYPKDGREIKELLMIADQNMYENKQQSKR